MSRAVRGRGAARPLLGSHTAAAILAGTDRVWTNRGSPTRPPRVDCGYVHRREQGSRGGRQNRAITYERLRSPGSRLANAETGSRRVRDLLYRQRGIPLERAARAAMSARSADQRQRARLVELA